MIETIIKKQEGIPEISKVFDTLGKLPENSIFLGVCKCCDIPILYDISEKSSPNILVWNRILGQGLILIKTCIEFIMKYKDQSKYRTEFVVLSNNSAEWDELSKHELGVWDKNACVAIVPFLNVVAKQVLQALAEWSVFKRNTKSAVILFVDGIENIDGMGEGCIEEFKKILSSGRSKGIYVIATSNHQNILTKWSGYFQKEVYGQSEMYLFSYDEPEKNVLFFCPKTEI